MGPSAWGAAALISAVDEGLAGIVDLGVKYDEILFAPRFPVTPYTELRYLTGYEVSKTLVDVRYILKEEGMRFDLYSPAKTVRAHILLPKGANCRALYIDKSIAEYTLEAVGDSVYLNAVCTPKGGKLSLEILLDR